MDAFTWIFILLISVYLLLLAGSFFFGLLKTLLKILTYLLGALMLLCLITGFFIYRDISDYRQNSEKPKLFLLSSGDNIKAAFDDSGRSIDVEELDERYAAKEYDFVLGDRYKFFVVSPGFFNEDSHDWDSGMFEQKLKLKLKEEPESLVMGLNNANIIIYKETISFKLIKYLPRFVTDRLIKEVQDGIHGQSGFLEKG